MYTHIRPEDWNKRTGKTNQNITNASRINSYIPAKEAEAEIVALEMENKSRSVTAYDIKSRTLGKVPEKIFVCTKNHEKIIFEELIA